LEDDVILCQQFLNKIKWEREEVSSRVKVFDGKFSWEYAEVNFDNRLYLITQATSSCAIFKVVSAKDLFSSFL
jgi:hypothetical protein